MRESEAPWQVPLDGHLKPFGGFPEVNGCVGGDSTMATSKSGRGLRHIHNLYFQELNRARTGRQPMVKGTDAESQSSHRVMECVARGFVLASCGGGAGGRARVRGQGRHWCSGPIWSGSD
jgi:hypothetical protein